MTSVGSELMPSIGSELNAGVGSVSQMCDPQKRWLRPHASFRASGPPNKDMENQH